MALRNAANLAVGIICFAALEACGAAPDVARPPQGASVNPRPAVESNARLASLGSSAACARVRGGDLPTPLSRQGSTIALATRGGSTLAYAADEDDDAIHTMDVDAPRELAVTPLGGTPSQVLVLADGRVAVALRDKNRIAIYEPREHADEPLELRCEASVFAEPVALAATPDARNIAVVSAWGRRISLLDSGSLASAFDATLARDPRSVVVDDDGRRAFVTHAIGGKISVVDLTAAAHGVRSIDVRVGGPFGGASRAASQGFALATLHDGSRLARVLAPMTSVDPGPAQATSVYGGASSWGPPAVMPLVAVIDAGTEKPFAQTTANSGALDKPCVLPRAAATFGSELLVTCLGLDALVDFDARGQNPARVERRRWKIAPGPNGVAIDEAHARAVVWSQFARELSVVDLRENSAPIARAAAARRQDSRMTSVLARGRALFHATQDPRISGDGRACASCHPDGREDGLTWSTPVGPRQTIMLAGRIAGTGPYGWFGASRTVKEHVTHTLHRLGGQGMADGDRADFDALIAYVTSLRGPNLQSGRVDSSKAALASRGREIFFGERQGCASCHTGGGTDGQQHDVGSGNVIESSLRFDTPSLQFIGGTAPYFHDGRYPTLVDLLEKSDGTMGHTLHLGTEDTLALAAFLETL
jgi:hypothetical protein